MQLGFPRPQAVHGVGSAKGSSRNQNMKGSCQLCSVHSTHMLNTANFTQCWDWGLGFIFFSLIFFFLPLVFKIH